MVYTHFSQLLKNLFFNTLLLCFYFPVGGSVASPVVRRQLWRKAARGTVAVVNDRTLSSSRSTRRTMCITTIATLEPDLPTWRHSCWLSWQPLWCGWSVQVVSRMPLGLAKYSTKGQSEMTRLKRFQLKQVEQGIRNDEWCIQRNLEENGNPI